VEQKQKEEKFDKDDEFVNLEQKSLIGDTNFEKLVLQKAKFLMSYVHAKELYEKFISALGSCDDTKDSSKAKEAILQAIEKEDDPRFKECMGIIFNDVYAKFIQSENIDLKSISWS
ncbi:MAG: hydrogenase, partial [Campylobacter sp.]|nr:hydrogenase [Campylobacter sp.]